MKPLAIPRQSYSGEDIQGWVIFCPACKSGHYFDSRWTFNGNVDAPTFAPSMLVTWEGGEWHHVCHSFVRDGKIEYLDDCTHRFKGKTVPLEPIE